VIGRFPIAQTVSGYENQILIGQIRERNVVRKKAAVLWGGALRDEPKNGCEGDHFSRYLP